MVNSTLTPEVLVPRLGEYLVQSGKISQEALEDALEYQKTLKLKGKQVRFGEVLVDRGLIEKADLDQAITEQIIQFRNALENANRTLEKRVAERTAEVQEALRKLSELSKLKSNFIANISHELRTPLTHLKGYIELLTTSALGPLTDEQSDALQVCKKSSSSLEGLIDSLILFAQSSRGELTLNLEPVDISRVAVEIIHLSKAKAHEKGVDLVTLIQPELPMVNVDEEKISWVMLQLLDNAIKFTSSGGRVTLNIKAGLEGNILVAITDTGIGIPESRIKEIFEAFHQLDGSSTRSFGGTGLGLALVKDILDAHGSPVDVRSETGTGTVFQFTLKVVE